MLIPISMMYAGLFAIFALVLSARAGMFRASHGISILFGDPVDMELAQRVRVHQNFLEYVPLMLILMAAIEANGGSAWFLFIVGDLLIIARIAHAIGLKHDNIQHGGRFIGAAGTALITLVSAGYALWLATPAVLARAGELLGSGG
jgi:uncharacterized membrane protein YecN with MAPEG domain